MFVYIYNLQRIWSRHFCGISSLTKNTCATLQAQVTRASKIWLWIFNACFTQITSSKIERSFGFDWFFFRWVRFCSIVEFNRTQSMNWVRLSSIGFDWNWVRLGSIYYAGNNITTQGLTLMERVHCRTRRTPQKYQINFNPSFLREEETASQA